MSSLFEYPSHQQVDESDVGQWRINQIKVKMIVLRGFAKKKIPKIQDYYGSGWVGPGLSEFFFVKSSKNSPKPVLIFWSRIPCVFCLYNLYIAKSC